MEDAHMVSQNSVFCCECEVQRLRCAPLFDRTKQNPVLVSTIQRSTGILTAITVTGAARST